MLDEQRVIREIRAGLAASNVEQVYKWLIRAKKKEVRIWPKVLSEVIQNTHILARTKKIAIEMLTECIEDVEYRDEVLDSTKSTGFLLGILSIMHEETQITASTFSSDIPDGIISVLYFFEKLVLASEHPVEKDLIVSRMEYSGVFLLANAWVSPGLLRMYNAIFRMEDIHSCLRMQSYIRMQSLMKVKETDNCTEKNNHQQKNQNKHRESKDIPYRTLIEEKVLGTETILVHRRKTRMFTPVHVRMCRKNAPKVYANISSFQDEYEIIHRSLKNWCDANGSLDGVEWVCIYHMNNVIANLERDETYQKELLFLLEPQFHSALINTISTPSLVGVKLYSAYLLLLERGSVCQIPEIRGTVSVAAERLGLSNARYFLDVLKEKKQDPQMKIEAVHGLYLLLQAFPLRSLHSLRKLLEKNASHILEMLEIQPEECNEIHSGVNGIQKCSSSDIHLSGANTQCTIASELHCSSVISLLAGMESMPLELFRPSSMILILWVTESPISKAMPEKNRKWLIDYARVLHSTYHKQGKDRLTAGLYF